MPVLERKKKKVVSKTEPKKPFKGFQPMIRSRHPSHNSLRTKLPKFMFRSCIRLGSTTRVEDGHQRVEINTIPAIENSASKFKMKTCFTQGGVKTAKWGKLALVSSVTPENVYIGTVREPLKFPLIFKPNFGSRGTGLKLAKNIDEYKAIVASIRSRINDYLIEEYHNFVREYRMHVTEAGCFYTCRKMLERETPEDQRFYRNDSNCVWIIETNPEFDKPSNWAEIEKECVKALKSVGLDFGACDIRVQSSKNSKGQVRENPDFIIVEINSAPSFGEGTLKEYLKMLPNLIKQKRANVINQ